MISDSDDGGESTITSFSSPMKHYKVYGSEDDISSFSPVKRFIPSLVNEEDITTFISPKKGKGLDCHNGIQTSYSSPVKTPQVTRSRLSSLNNGSSNDENITSFSTPTPSIRLPPKLVFGMVGFPDCKMMEFEEIFVGHQSGSPTSWRKLSHQLKRTLVQYDASVRNWDYSLNKLHSDALAHAPQTKILNLIIEKWVPLINKEKANDLHSPILAVCTSFQDTDCEVALKWVRFVNFCLALLIWCRSESSLEGILKHSLKVPSDALEIPSCPSWNKQSPTKRNTVKENQKHVVGDYKHEVIFKPKMNTPLDEGTHVKLFPPWMETYLPEICESVVYCTDFYKTCEQTEAYLLPFLKSWRESIKAVIDEKVYIFLNERSEDEYWHSLLPYMFWNTRTILKQVKLLKDKIDLDVVICEAWTCGDCVQLLVKDSDNILSLIDGIPNIEQYAEKFEPGVTCRFTNILVGEKIPAETWLPLFSLIAAFNVQQAQFYKYYYCVWFILDSSVTFPEHVNIPFHQADCPKLNTKQISEIPVNHDCRVTLEGVLGEMKSTEVVLIDDDGTLGIRPLPSFGPWKPAMGEGIVLHYVRVFRGICTLDQFSLIKRTQGFDKQCLVSTLGRLM